MSKFAAFSLLSLLCSLIFSVQGEVFFQDSLDNLQGWQYPYTYKEEGFTYMRVLLGSGQNFQRAQDDSIGILIPGNREKIRIALSKAIEKPFQNLNQDFVVSYETMNEIGQFCGGAYIKLLDKDADMDSFSDETPYLLMFGPDFCEGISELKIIFRQSGGGYLQWKRYLSVPHDSDRHVYTLVWKKNGTYKVKIDGEDVVYGYIENDFESVADSYFSVGVGSETEEENLPFIYDEEAVKKLNEIKQVIEDPKDIKPSTWDDEVQGEWKRRMNVNLAYLTAKEQLERKMRNPKFQPKDEKAQAAQKRDSQRFHELDGTVGLVGIELAVTNGLVFFDNFYIGDSEQEVNEYLRGLFSFQSD